MDSKKKPPTAPPAYRPRSAPKVAQPKIVGAPRRNPPPAPPACRPHPGAGQGEETFASFFTFHGDPQNFNTGELKQYVEDIYEK